MSPSKGAVPVTQAGHNPANYGAERLPLVELAVGARNLRLSCLKADDDFDDVTRYAELARIKALHVLILSVGGTRKPPSSGERSGGGGSHLELLAGRGPYGHLASAISKDCEPFGGVTLLQHTNSNSLWAATKFGLRKWGQRATAPHYVQQRCARP